MRGLVLLAMLGTTFVSACDEAEKEGFGGTSADADADADADSGLSFSVVWADTVSPACSGCHSGNDPRGDLDMSTESSAYENLLADYVIPGDPDTSELYEKISITGPGVMPPSSQDPLTTEQIDGVALWITEGALP